MMAGQVQRREAFKISLIILGKDEKLIIQCYIEKRK